MQTAPKNPFQFRSGCTVQVNESPNTLRRTRIDQACENPAVKGSGVPGIYDYRKSGRGTPNGQAPALIFLDILVKSKENVALCILCDMFLRLSRFDPIKES